MRKVITRSNGSLSS